VTLIPVGAIADWYKAAISMKKRHQPETVIVRRHLSGSVILRPASLLSTTVSTSDGASISYGQQEIRIISKSPITTDEIPNPTPGEILLLEFIEPPGLTQNGLARAIGVPPRRINEIVHGKRAITADTDLRLARCFGLSEGLWLGLQSDHDLLRQRRKIVAALDRIEPRPAAA
jgi:antitoxin HigA-1